jgi:DNA replication protein DnaC
VVITRQPAHLLDRALKRDAVDEAVLSRQMHHSRAVSSLMVNATRLLNRQQKGVSLVGST